MEQTGSARIRFEGVTPILRVAKLTASIDYYVRVLGFELRWKSPIFACVARDRCHLFLSEGDQGHPGTWVWIGVADAPALCEQYRLAGAKVRHQPTNYDWACEMQVEDLDGNVLRIGSEPDENEPVGEWLDMDGLRWRKATDGGWIPARD
jgi:catechol 2,3-dioxygenase-like lactoylglutathione lyase family enzyme